MQCAVKPAVVGHLVKESVKGVRAPVWLCVYRLVRRGVEVRVLRESMWHANRALTKDARKAAVVALMHALLAALIRTELVERAPCTKDPGWGSRVKIRRLRDSCGVSAWAISGGGIPSAETDQARQIWSTFGNACAVRAMNGERKSNARGTRNKPSPRPRRWTGTSGLP